jgi:hypothetical protein
MDIALSFGGDDLDFQQDAGPEELGDDVSPPMVEVASSVDSMRRLSDNR